MKRKIEKLKENLSSGTILIISTVNVLGPFGCSFVVSSRWEPATKCAQGRQEKERRQWVTPSSKVIRTIEAPAAAAAAAAAASE